MRRRLSVAETRDQIDTLIERVSADGDEVEIERDGAVIARIVPVRNGEMMGTSTSRWSAIQLADPNDIWAGYDPERMRKALDESFGALAGIDAEEWKRDVKAMRGQDSIGRPGN